MNDFCWGCEFFVSPCCYHTKSYYWWDFHLSAHPESRSREVINVAFTFYAKGATFESKQKTQGQPTPIKKVSLKVQAQLPMPLPKPRGKMEKWWIPNLSVLVRNLSVGHLVAGSPKRLGDVIEDQLTWRQTGKLRNKPNRKKKEGKESHLRKHGSFLRA